MKAVFEDFGLLIVAIIIIGAYIVFVSSFGTTMTTAISDVFTSFSGQVSGDGSILPKLPEVPTT